MTYVGVDIYFSKPSSTDCVFHIEKNKTWVSPVTSNSSREKENVNTAKQG